MGEALGSGLWAELCVFFSQGKRTHQDVSQRGRSGDGEADDESSSKLYRMDD